MHANYEDNDCRKFVTILPRAAETLKADMMQLHEETFSIRRDLSTNLELWLIRMVLGYDI